MHLKSLKDDGAKDYNNTSNVRGLQSEFELFIPPFWINMSGRQQPNRLAAKEESRLNFKALSDSDNMKALEKLDNLLKRCFGPFSSNIILQNELGGYAITTSACVRLVNALPIENAIVRLVTTATLGHGNNLSDGSLFTALLTLSLIQEGLKLDMHRHLISTVFELIMEECKSYILSEGCTAKHKLSFESTDELFKLARCVISTKPGSMIDSEETDHIARLLLVAFISSVSENNSTSLHLIPVEGQQPIRSEVKPGFIYNAPELWSDENKPVHCRTIESGSRIRTVLVGCSMAGDSDDYIDGKYEMHSRTRKEDVVIQLIKQWLDTVIRQDVGIVFCQKVVHDDIKELLQKQEIIVIERLGTVGANTVQKLTDGPLIHSLHSALTLSQCGSVESIEQLGQYNKTYLQVQGNSEVSTVMLCHHSEDPLDELKASCEQAYAVLRGCLGQPYALYGGGCWLTQLAHHVTQKATDLSWLAAAECPSHMLPPIVEAFTRSLRRLPALLRTDREHYVDSTTHHHWMLVPSVAEQITENVRCVCGAVEWNEEFEFLAFEELVLSHNHFGGQSEKHKSNEKAKSVQNRVRMYSRNMMSPDPKEQIGDASVLDGLASSVNGLQTAVLAANMVLSISNVIKDCN